MMRSMYSGVAGLRTHQTKMDVIGNNIANVNTAGFKASAVTFSDVFYQTTQSAAGPNNLTGTAGLNAKQIGLGSSVAAITKNITETGGSQTTNDPFNVMINGDAFFIVNSGGVNYFTKSGAFLVDANGTLCTPTGATVMGWQVDPDDPTKCRSDQVSSLRVMSAENSYADPEATTKAYLSGNIDKKDTQVAAGASGKNFQVSFYDKLGYSYTAKFVVNQASSDGETLNTSVYNVKLKDIVDENNKSIFITEVQGDDGITYQQSGWGVSMGVSNEATGGDEGDYATPEIPEGLDKPQLDLSSGEDTEGYSFNLIFDGESGKFVSLAAAGTTEVETGEDANLIKNMVLGIGGTPPIPFENVEIDFSQLTMFSSSGSSSIESTMGDVDGNGKGKEKGELKGISIDTAGKIYGSYSNSDLKLLGQIAVTTFPNAAGLEAVGDSMFQETQNSGRFDGVGQDPTTGGGSLSTGVLEMSNVDLSAQFTDMITTQRGFQANSRIITTSDTLLEELINLKR